MKTLKKVAYYATLTAACLFFIGMGLGDADGNTSWINLASIACFLVSAKGADMMDKAGWGNNDKRGSGNTREGDR